MRNLGEMAENQLQLWASQVRITCNKANMDLEGWDFFLQFPFSSLDGKTSADRQSPRIECLVQVKGTNRTNIGIKLSNLQKHVLDSLPVFFLFLQYSETNELISAHLTHLDESLIIKILEKLRNFSKYPPKKKNGKKKNLNECYMYLTWDDDHLLPSFDGQGLMEGIRQHIGVSMSNYMSWKMKVRETAGDPIPAIVRSTFEFGSDDQAWTELVDFTIGLQESLSAVQLTMEEDVRFNIPWEIKELGEGTIKITPPNIACNLLFHDKDQKIEISYPGELYTPRWFFADSEIPPEYQKYRATFNFGEVIILPGLGRGEIKINLPPIEQKLNIEEIYNNWRLVNLFNQNKTIYITVTVLREEKDYVIPLAFDDNSFLSQSDVEIWKLVEITRWLTRVLDLPSDISLSISQLINQREKIELLRQIYDRRQSISPVIVTIPEEIVEEVLKKEFAIPLVRAIRLGDRVILITAAVAGFPSLTGDSQPGYQQIELVGARVIILEHQEFSSESDLPIKSIVENLEGRLDSDGYNYFMDE